MSVTYGFYDSIKGDRRYNAKQMSSIFDGIIRDGVLQHVGTAMMVKESEGMIINVGIGRAWFNHTWTLNDALLPLEVPISEVILNRIDAVVVDVDARENVRANSIKIVKGTPATNPKNPTMINTNDHWQYPLAYIRVNSGVTAIRQANITNCVGTSACPFVTAPLEKMSIDALVAQWSDQWEEFFDNETAEMERTNQSWQDQWRTWFQAQTTEIQEAYLNWEQEWDTWYASQTSEMTETNKYWKDLWQSWFYDYVNSNTEEYSNWKTSINQDFIDWWDSLKELLVGNPDAEFAMKLLDLQNRVETLEGLMKTLSDEHCIYDTVDDNLSEGITDSNGSLILCRKVIFLVANGIS